MKRHLIIITLVGSSLIAGNGTEQKNAGITSYVRNWFTQEKQEADLETAIGNQDIQAVTQAVAKGGLSNRDKAQARTLADTYIDILAKEKSKRFRDLKSFAGGLAASFVAFHGFAYIAGKMLESEDIKGMEFSRKMNLELGDYALLGMQTVGTSVLAYRLLRNWCTNRSAEQRYQRALVIKQLLDNA